MHRLGRRRVLDQLDQPVAVHHLARRHAPGCGPARRPSRPPCRAGPPSDRPAGCARPSARLAPPVSMARRSAAGLDSQQQGRAHGVDELPQVEIAAAAARPHPCRLRRLALLQQPVRGQQVHLLEGPVDRVVLPFRGREALVAALRRLGRGGARPGPTSAGRPGSSASIAGCQSLALSSAAEAQAGAGRAQRAQPDGAQRRGRSPPSPPARPRASGWRSTSGRSSAAAGRAPGSR